MSDTLRDRILLALIHSTPSEYLPPPNAMSTQVDAVIEALNLNTPVEYLSVDGKRQNFMVAGHYTIEVS